MQVDSRNYINFNLYLDNIQVNILDTFYQINQELNLKKITNLFYFEILDKILKYYKKDDILVFSKINSDLIFDFCSKGKFENFYFQKVEIISKLINTPIAINRYKKFDELKYLKSGDIDELIVQSNLKNLKKLHTFLEQKQMYNLSLTIKENIDIKRKLLCN